MTVDKRLPQDLVDFIERFVRKPEAKALLLSDAPPSDLPAIEKDLAAQLRAGCGFNTSMLLQVAYEARCGFAHVFEAYQRAKRSAGRRRG